MRARTMWVGTFACSLLAVACGDFEGWEVLGGDNVEGRTPGATADASTEDGSSPAHVDGLPVARDSGTHDAGAAVLDAAEEAAVDGAAPVLDSGTVDSSSDAGVVDASTPDVPVSDASVPVVQDAAPSPSDAAVADSGATEPAHDAGHETDAGQPSDAGTSDVTPPVETCVGPFVTIEGATYDHVTDDGLPFAVVASNLCPSLAVTSDAIGAFTIQVPQGKEFYFRTTHEGYVTSLTPELRFDADGLMTTRAFPAAPVFVGPLAGLFAAGPLFIPKAWTDDRLPPSGISITLSGGPATVVYPEANWSWSGIATMTGTSGNVVVYGMTPSSMLALFPSKPDCQVVWRTNNETGNLRFESGAVTVQNMWVACEKM